jgi:hypothetical protein
MRSKSNPGVRPSSPLPEHAAAEEAGGARLGDRVAHPLVGVVVLAPHVQHAEGRLDRPAGDQHPLDQLVRVVLHEVAVLEAAGLRLVGVADDEALAAVDGRHERPLQAGREARAAAAAQAGRLDLVDHLRRRHRGQGLLGGGVAAVVAVVRERVGALDAHVAVEGDLEARVEAAGDGLRASATALTRRPPSAAVGGRRGGGVAFGGGGARRARVGLLRPDVVAAALARRRGLAPGAHLAQQVPAARARDALVVGVVDLQHGRGAARPQALDALQREQALGVGLARHQPGLLDEEAVELVGPRQRARQRAAHLQVVAARRMLVVGAVEAHHALGLGAGDADDLGDLVAAAPR